MHNDLSFKWKIKSNYSDLLAKYNNENRSKSFFQRIKYSNFALWFASNCYVGNEAYDDNDHLHLNKNSRCLLCSLGMISNYLGSCLCQENNYNWGKIGYSTFPLFYSLPDGSRTRVDMYRYSCWSYTDLRVKSDTKCIYDKSFINLGTSIKVLSIGSDLDYTQVTIQVRFTFVKFQQIVKCLPYIEMKVGFTMKRQLDLQLIAYDAILDIESTSMDIDYENDMIKFFFQFKNELYRKYVQRQYGIEQEASGNYQNEVVDGELGAYYLKISLNTNLGAMTRTNYISATSTEQFTFHDAL